MALPPGNIYWRDIPTSATVEETKTAFVVHVGRAKATAYWHGQEALVAQRHLKKLANAKPKTRSTRSGVTTIQTPAGKKHIGRRVGVAKEYYFELPSPSAPNGGWWTLNPQHGFVSVPSNSRALRAAIEAEDTRKPRRR